MPRTAVEWTLHNQEVVGLSKAKKDCLGVTARVVLAKQKLKKAFSPGPTIIRSHYIPNFSIGDGPEKLCCKRSPNQKIWALGANYKRRSSKKAEVNEALNREVREEYSCFRVCFVNSETFFARTYDNRTIFVAPSSWIEWLYPSVDEILGLCGRDDVAADDLEAGVVLPDEPDHVLRRNVQH